MLACYHLLHSKAEADGNFNILQEMFDHLKVQVQFIARQANLFDQNLSIFVYYGWNSNEPEGQKSKLAMNCIFFLTLCGCLLLPGGMQVTARSQMAALLCWMSMKGLRPIPMNTLSCIRSSGTFFFYYSEYLFKPGNHVGQFRKQHVACTCVVTTSAVSGLVPQDLLQVGGPGFLHIHAGGPQRVGVLTFSPAEPDFKTQTAHTWVVCHPNVARLREKTRDSGETYEVYPHS